MPAAATSDATIVEPAARRVRRVRLAALAAVVFFVAMIAARWDARTGWTELLRFAGNTPALTQLPALQGLPVARMRANGGYDGQFYVQLALYPGLQEPALKKTLDGPAYRSRRIFCGWVAWLAGAGDPWRTLQAFALINVAAWFALAALLRHWLPLDNWRNAAAWFALLFSVGAIDSVRYSLTDLPALALLAAAVLASQSGQRALAVVGLAAAALTRETSLLATGILAPVANWRARRAWLAGGLGLVVVAAPLAGWLLYVRLVFGAGGEVGGGNFSWPLVGWLRQLAACGAELLAGHWNARAGFGLLGALSLAWQVAWLCWRRRPDDAWWRIGVAHVLLFAVLGDAVWGSYWAAMRAMLPMTAAYTLSLRGEKHFWPLLWAGHLTLAHAIWRLLPL